MDRGEVNLRELFRRWKAVVFCRRSAAWIKNGAASHSLRSGLLPRAAPQLRRAGCCRRTVI